MRLRNEIYNLSKSKTIEISSINLDIKADIKLNTNERKLNIDSSISGIVVDVLNNPIKNAIVKLINNNLEPIASTKTDENGKYVISVIPTSTSYTVLATAIEKVVNQSTSFTLKLGENKFISFTLSNDPNILFGAISGILTDSNNNVLKGAVILLYKEENNSKKLFAITYSDSQGTFLFSELLQGQYKILVQSLTNMPYEESIKVESRKIYNFNKSLNFNSNLSEGSISGFISDNLGNSIAQADVILYKVENNIKTPVAFTKTNAFGMYSFANVPFGSYLVKSNASQNLDLTNIISPSVKITSTSELGTYKFSTGILENGAILDSTGFINFLGGEKDGSVTLSITAEKYGLYTLAVYYVAADFNRALKVTINGRELDETYKVAITPGWEVSDSKIFEVLTSLNEGVNIIKFHGDGKSLAPKLSMITLILNETENQTVFTTPFSFYNNIIFENISLAGLYFNGAKYDKETFLATALGGTNDGAVTVDIYIKETGLYFMTLKYLSLLPNLTLKIDVNTIPNNNVYKLPQSSKTEFLDVSSFTIPFFLNEGVNTLKFHGDNKNFSPDLDSFYLQPPPITQNFIEGFFENDAKSFLNEKFVIGLGGPKNGAVTVAMDVAMYGYYKFYIEYVATTTTLPLKIDINGINNSTITYLVPPTGQLNVTDKKIFSMILYLNTGINTLRFYGNGKDLAPNLSSFTIIKTISISSNIDSTNIIKDIYEAKDAKLSGSAVLDKSKKFITYIGGKNNGTALFNVMVKDAGEYLLQITCYLLGKFKMDVNDKSYKDFYIVSGKNSGIFKTIINLKAGANTLKFYGFSEELSPYLGDFTLNLNLPLYFRLSDFHLKNASKILTSGIITSLGGENQGYIFIDYFALDITEYTLNIVISNEDKELLININFDYIVMIKNIPKIQSPTIMYSKNLILNSGKNLIEFLGNGTKPAPNIYFLDLIPTNPDASKLIFNLENATFKNKVRINLNNGFVENIGSKDNGTATLTIQVDVTDFYDLNIEYINPYDIDTPFRLNINNKLIETTYYIPASENIYDFSKIKIFTIEKILLNKGKTSIEFMGNGIDYVAYLGKVRLIKSNNIINVPNGVYPAIKGKFENGAKIASFSKNFVDKLGGNNLDGSVIINANVDESGFYELLIEYLVITDNNTLLIEVNGDDTGAIYTLPKTDGLKEENSKNFTVAVLLNEGDNSIKFHGDKINIAPSLGIVNINKSPEFKTYPFINAILNNAEVLDKPSGFISLNSSIKLSLAYMKVNVENTGIYYLTFKYLSKNVNSVNVLVKNINYSRDLKLPATKRESILDVKVFTTKIQLNIGENLIYFIKYKNINDTSLLLHSFVISTNKLIQTIPMKKAILLKGAYFNENTSLVHGLGGLSNGSAIIDIPIAKSGLYNLVINYISLKIQRKLKLTINGVSIKNSYYFPSTGEILHKIFFKSVTIPINLKSGINKIKLHGKHDSIESPMISEITLSLNTNDIIKIYYLSEGTIKGGAIANKESKSVSNIGGKNNGEVIINFNIETSNIYDLKLQYKSLNTNSILYLEVNNNGAPKSYKLPMTANISFKTFSIKVFLDLGNNSLRFYGDINNNNLILGNFSLVRNITSSNFNFNQINSNVILGELKNGVELQLGVSGKSWAKNLGGTKNGSSTLTLDVDYNGEYSLLVEYLLLPNNKLNSINNVYTITLKINSKPTGRIYTFSNNNYDKHIINKYEFIVTLVKGENKIKFSGDGKNPSPLLGDIILTIKYIKI